MKKKDEDAEIKKTQQVVEPASHGPMEISDPAVMFNMIMPMIMMLMMMAIMMPMVKGIDKK